MTDERKISRYWPGAIIAVAAIAAYANSFHGPLVFDDVGTIAENRSLRHLWPIWDALTPPREGMPVTGRPIANLSFALNYAMGGTRVWGYHAVNLLIHICAGLALFGIVQRTLKRWSPWMAFSVALLWTVHPLQTEAVTYLSQRVESLMGLFYLLTLYCFIRYAEGEEAASCRFYVGPWPWVRGRRDGPSRPEAAVRRTRGEKAASCRFYVGRWIGVRGRRDGSSRPEAAGEPPPAPRGGAATASVRSARGEKAPGGRCSPGLWAGLSVAACLLGMATKEVMATAPVILFLYDRTFISGTFRAAWRARWRLYLCLGSTWLLLGALMAVTGDRGGTAGFHAAVSWQAYAFTQFRAILHYLRLSIWPAPLVFFYGSTVGATPGAAVVVLILLAATLWLVFGPNPDRRRLGFAGAWFFLILAPSSSVVPVATETMSEHRMYLPLAAVAAVVGFGIFRLVAARARLAPARADGISLCLCALLAVACASATFRRNEDYRSELALWRTSVEGFPDDDIAQYNLGIMLARVGKTPEAITHYHAALRLNPGYAEARNNLGMALVDAGRPEEAVAEFREVLRVHPEFAVTHYNLANTLFQLGRVDEAIANYEECLRLEPDNSGADYALGTALARAGRMPEAIDAYEKALRLKPDVPQAQNDLAFALVQAGRVDEAVPHYEAAVRLIPDSPVLHNDLGCALAQLGRVGEARAQFEEVLRLDPANAGARGNLEHLRAQ